MQSLHDITEIRELNPLSICTRGVLIDKVGRSIDYRDAGKEPTLCGWTLSESTGSSSRLPMLALRLKESLALACTVPVYQGTCLQKEVQDFDGVPLLLPQWE